MFLDTTIIVEIFRSDRSSRRFKTIFDLIEDDILYISIIQLGEISDWCLMNKIDPQPRISEIKKIANIVPINEEICFEGSIIKFEMRKKGTKKFSLIDGIILASARYVGQELISTDNDFRKAEDVVIIR
jgi:predicted nucleic acid-binding protein